jgi:hypothetical protein
MPEIAILGKNFFLVFKDLAEEVSAESHGRYTDAENKAGEASFIVATSQASLPVSLIVERIVRRKRRWRQDGFFVIDKRAAVPP